MKNNYFYLIASLPMLQFGAKPAFSYSYFLEECKRHLTPDDAEALEKGDTPLLKKWETFDTCLRNELVKARAVKKGRDPHKYLRMSEGINPFLAPLAHWAVNQDSPIQAERYLDRIRWEKIEEIRAGHYFDIEHLAAYGLELKILERWAGIGSSDGMKILERMTERE